MKDKTYCKKTSFLTEAIANGFIERLKVRKERERKKAEKAGITVTETETDEKMPTYAYLCRYCNTWHLTSEEKKTIDYIKTFTPPKMDKKEKELENECCRIARQKGLAAVKLEQTGHKGIPDRIFIEAGGRVMFVEFKNPNGRGVISAEQKQWAKFIGYKHSFISSVSEFNKMLKFHFDL